MGCQRKFEAKPNGRHIFVGATRKMFAESESLIARITLRRPQRAFRFIGIRSERYRNFTLNGKTEYNCTKRCENTAKG